MPAPAGLPTNVTANTPTHPEDSNVAHGWINDATVVPPATVTASRTLALADCGEALLVDSASAVTITVPPNSAVAFPVGVVIGVTRMGTGTVTVAAGAGVTIRQADATLTLRAQYAVAALHKIAPDEWVLSGDLG